MIKANELRLGNLLDNGYNIVHVTSINLDYNEDREPISEIGVCLNGNLYDEVVIKEAAFGIEVKPIPLTPEWLERCGLVNNEIMPSYKLHMAVRPYQTAIQGVFPGEWQVTLIDAVPYPIGQTIKYVHQLQNLYFALTGEELQIKL